MTTRPNDRSATRFEIRFESLHRPGKGMAFPCDEDGGVDVNALPRRAQSNYLFARGMVGREFTYPVVVGA